MIDFIGGPMKSLILMYFLILLVSCELTVTDGENNYRLGFNDTENQSGENEVSFAEDRHVFENMNIDAIKINEYEPREIIISKVSNDGIITEEIGSFEVIDGNVLLPEMIQLSGFYHFELILDEQNIQIVVPEFKNPKKRNKSKHHHQHFYEKQNLPSYILGPREREISDEVMFLVQERGYSLAPSFKFVHKQNMSKERAPEERQSDFMPKEPLENIDDTSEGFEPDEILHQIDINLHMTSDVDDYEFQGEEGDCAHYNGV